MSFILSLLFGMVMSISCDWLHFCFLARVLKCIVVVKKVLTGLHDSCSSQIDCSLAFIV